ncbi:FAD-dependent oxidoreductase [Nocardioides dubius]|uniref:FAD-dependent oxidoreductase n=1 Tax=Nocardioides dubius TaxID=317019 RepID=A0ABP4EI26_9ACTN
MSTRIVVIGADATGMSAAHQALRSARSHGREVEVTVLEATEHTSYSACGLPYWISGEVPSGDDLVARSPEQHRAMGVDLRTGARVLRVDAERREVRYRHGGAEQVLGYDELVIATGAHPIVPAWAQVEGVAKPGLGVVKNLDDGALWLDRLTASSGRHVVIAGGGYVGIEMAEAALARGHRVTLAARSRLLSMLEPGMSALLADTLKAAGVEVLLDTAVDGVDHDDQGRLRAVLAGARRIEADYLILALGVVPATEFLAGSGVPLTERGALRPDPSGRVAPGVWAGGDCCEVRHRVLDDWRYLPLGTHANKMGRAIGENLGGGELVFPGALGSAITRFSAPGGYLEVAATGLNLQQARAAGFDAVEVVTEGTTASGYHPDAAPIRISLVGDRATGRLLGGQVLGGRGAAKRIDVVAMALWSNLTAHDLAWADLAYAPPFATAWEIISLASRRLAERLG